MLKKENLDEAIIIVTSNKRDINLGKIKEICIIDYDNLIKKLNLENNKDILFIRDYSVNIENPYREIKKQKILDYIYEEYKKQKIKPGYNKILKELHLDLYTYFNSLSEPYKILKIPPPIKNRLKTDNELINLWKEEFKKYILEEISKGKKYPSGEEIQKHFEVSIWNITKVSDLYRELGLEPYHERKIRVTYVQEY